MTETTNNTKENAAEDALVITRVFDAPRALVWKTWTDPERVKLWWGPQHFTAPVCRMDFRTGGKVVCCMLSPEGQEYWSTGVYREIVPMEKIVCTDSFADKDGNVVPASHYGVGEDYPLELLVTVSFEDFDSKTKFTLRHEGIPAGMIRETRDSWGTCLDKFDALLAS